MKYLAILTAVSLLLRGVPAIAQEPPQTEALETQDEVYRLPETEVTETRDNPNRVTQEDLERDNAADLWEAVRYIPGVILSGGGRRGDSNFTVRGYGAEDVPIFVDGVVMANPYRGEGDAARFLTGDLESVEIQKGFSTSLLGANTLGGAVLVRTAKPKKPLELMVRENLSFDALMGYGDSATVAGVGTKLRLFYGRAVFQFRDVNHFRLSDAFEPSPDNPQSTGNRLYSDSRDFKLTLMAGVTPLEALDLWLTYTYQDADKGVSPPDIRVRRSSPDFVLWDWPFWKRQTVSLNGSFTLNPLSLSALWYFDKYDNRLDTYYDIIQYDLGIHAPHSDYDEYSFGGRLTGKWRVNDWNEVEAALTYKKEDHKGLKGGYSGFPGEEDMTEIVHINEDTWSFGAEWNANPWKPLTIKAGFGFNALIPIDYWGLENEFSQWIQAGYYVVQTRNMFLYTWQAGLFYDITPDHQVRLTYARKNHFPNMSQRYSTRFGSALPNPSLGPEIANHFEIGYTGALFNTLSVNAALYYSLMSGKIVNVTVPDPNHPSYELNYARNLDTVSFYGFELAPEWFPNEYLRCALAFSLNQYALNRSQDGDIKAIPYYPAVTVNAYAEIKPVPRPLAAWPHLREVSIIPRLEFISPRFGDSAGTEALEAYVLVHLKVSAGITEYCTVSLGLENIFDTFYEIRRNSPLAGRTFMFSVTGRY